MLKNKDYTLLLLPVVLLGVVIIKFPHLFLPHYWDEAWSYSPAIQYMYENHLGIIPGALPADLSRGHPLLFYFLSSGWMRIFGPELFSRHCFALAVSLVYLVSIWYIVRKLFSKRAGIMATVITACQALFLTQASMLLPEIMLSLFTIWTLYAYLQKKSLLYIFASSLLILTKETGIFLLIIIFVWDFFEWLFSGKMRSSVIKQIQRNLMLSIPFLVFALHLVLQKRVFGWYLFPEHISLMTTFSQGIKELGSQEYFLQFYGQIYLVITLIASFCILMFRRKKIPAWQKKSLWMIFSFLLLYLFASTFLLFSPRYLMCIHIILVLLTVFYLDFITRSMVWLPVAVTIILAANLLYLALTLRSNGDYNLGCTDAMLLQKDAVNYLERNRLYDHTIYCGFLMQKNMTIKAAGFLEGRPFTRLTGSLDPNPEYILLTSTEPEPNYYRIKYSISDSLIRHWERNYMWMEIYKKKR